MHIRHRPSWELPESAATPESVYLSRRALLGAGAGLIGTLGLPGGAQAGFLDSLGLSGGDKAPKGPAPGDPANDPTKDLYPARHNDAFTLDRPVTPEDISANYNNFYEFGSDRSYYQVADVCAQMPRRPWTVKIDGLVEKEREVGIDDLIRAMALEERLYRHRCVEAWSMAVPWTGFPVKDFVSWARPLSSAKYMRMETFLNPDVAAGQRRFTYPWPYVDGLTMAEATNDLAFFVTGIYGKPAPNQFGAPLRLAVPWKYGFKSVKSIVRISFVEERPVGLWEQIQGREYGFWANVNPAVPHPRWSQASERDIGTGERRPTEIYNGYGEQVAGLYAGIKGENLFM
ncbi:protein-methionine-sulfoxide reductase catalytic subunit MsrP [Ancylobacter mangrovi]|uniref:protein-methionine-sulfoxide reductase catalytic subunit MsrP n=1 Tax=Ancylobacter mangrovi TaxID=2972472 RepID=UPI0021631A54|nr:protein-methionine-sulfoxide reductase catalytic subunit MsrP [Ancylobacter mangrovi]MCS0501652.1 protein-methionine-sulfoxide reductase catalytic subunit MsrP [Ancylobacter mangrovi]